MKIYKIVLLLCYKSEMQELKDMHAKELVDLKNRILILESNESHSLKCDVCDFKGNSTEGTELHKRKKHIDYLEIPSENYHKKKASEKLINKDCDNKGEEVINEVENYDKNRQPAANVKVPGINKASVDSKDVEPETIAYSCPEPRCEGSWCRPHSKSCKIGIADNINSDRTCDSCNFVAASKKALKKHKC